MTSSNDRKGLATIKADSTSKPLNLTAGELNPEIICAFENACMSYFDNKNVDEKHQVQKILFGFKDPCLVEWIASGRNRLKALSFTEFMKEFRAGFLGDQWEQLTRREVMAIYQGSSLFWEYAQRVQSKNALLHVTPLHFDKDALILQIEAGMDTKLTLRVDREALVKVDFLKWLNDVKRLDEIIASDCLDFQAIASRMRDTSRNNNNVFTKLSQKVNTSQNNAQSQTQAQNRVPFPKLTDVEKGLLNTNKGCYKCHQPFIQHHSCECPNGFPKEHTTITQSFIDSVKSSKSKKTSKLIAAVGGSYNCSYTAPDSHSTSSHGYRSYPGPSYSRNALFSRGPPVSVVV